MPTIESILNGDGHNEPREIVIVIPVTKTRSPRALRVPLAEAIKGGLGIVAAIRLQSVFPNNVTIRKKEQA